MWKRANNSSGGGGQMVETVLWTNSNPSASTFAAQAVTLSEDIDNYDFIAIEYARAYNNLTSKNKVYYKVSDFKTFKSTGTYMTGALTIAAAANQARICWYESDTSVRFGSNFTINGTQTLNGNNIPLNVYGCKIG